MNFATSVIIFMLLTAWGAYRVAAPRDRTFLITAGLASWALLAPLVTLVHYWIPFAGGGDDLTYFLLASSYLKSSAGTWSFETFSQVLAQPGYPALIVFMNAFSDASLLTLKSTNVFFFILTAMVWYRIAYLLEGSGFARFVTVAVLLLVPMWFYLFYLLKDIVIVFLQSVFIWGAILFWNGKNVKAAVLIGFALFSLIFFRIPLVLQDLMIMVAAAALILMRQGKLSNKLAFTVLFLMIFGVAMAIATDAGNLQSLGITSEIHALTSDNIRYRTEQSQGLGTNRTLFPILYFLIETTALSPQAWLTIDATALRGFLVIPWLLLVPPILPFGFQWILQRPWGAAKSNAVGTISLGGRVFSTPWAIIALFFLSSIAASWVVSDTTRWRLPDLPVLLVIAAAGWRFSSSGLKRPLMLAWGLLLIFAFSVLVLRGLL